MVHSPSSITEDTDFFCENDEALREVRPFYWLLTLVLAVLYAWSVVSSPGLKETSRLVLFTALMLLHAGLHWIGPRLTIRRRWLIPYFAVQGALVFALSLLAGNQGVSVGLYISMAGEAVGILEDVRLSAAMVIAYLALSALNFGLLWGWDRLLSWLVWIAPVAFFASVYIVMFIRQAKAREHAQVLLNELEVAHRQLADYAERVEELTLAAERQRMARELHDTLAQGLAGVILQLEAADSHLENGRIDRSQAILRQAMARARAALAESRRAIDDLRASPIRPRDLSEAVRQEVDRFSSATGLPCALELSMPAELPDSLTDPVLRAVSEGLANVARHARAHHAGVQIGCEQGLLEVVVQDDGVGFDASGVEIQEGHYGLLGLRERARLSGGELQIDSAPGKGTKLKLSIPILLKVEG